MCTPILSLLKSAGTNLKIPYKLLSPSVCLSLLTDQQKWRRTELQFPRKYMEYLVNYACYYQTNILQLCSNCSFIRYQSYFGLQSHTKSIFLGSKMQQPMHVSVYCNARRGAGGFSYDKFRIHVHNLYPS